MGEQNSRLIQKAANQPLVWETGPITFDAPVGGWGKLVLYPNGNYEFSGHFHVSGAPSYDTTLAYVIVDANGQGYSFVRKVHLNGTFEAGSRDGDWYETGNRVELARGWPALMTSWHGRWLATTNWDWGIHMKQIEDGLGIVAGVIGIVF